MGGKSEASNVSRYRSSCTHFVGQYYYCMYVCMVAHIASQPGKVANPARGQLNREQGKSIFPCPRSRLRIWSRETVSAVPSILYNLNLQSSLFILPLMLFYFWIMFSFNRYTRDIITCKSKHDPGGLQANLSHAPKKSTRVRRRWRWWRRAVVEIWHFIGSIFVARQRTVKFSTNATRLRSNLL